MPMVQCPDCAKAISAAAVACPNCGRPMRKAPVPKVKSEGCFLQTLNCGCVCIVGFIVLLIIIGLFGTH